MFSLGKTIIIFTNCKIHTLFDIQHVMSGRGWLDDHAHSAVLGSYVSREVNVVVHVTEEFTAHVRSGLPQVTDELSF